MLGGNPEHPQGNSPSLRLDGVSMIRAVNKGHNTVTASFETPNGQVATVQINGPVANDVSRVLGG